MITVVISLAACAHGPLKRQDGRGIFSLRCLLKL